MCRHLALANVCGVSGRRATAPSARPLITRLSQRSRLCHCPAAFRMSRAPVSAYPVLLPTALCTLLDLYEAKHFSYRAALVPLGSVQSL